jgi:hypothetical protein
LRVLCVKIDEKLNVTDFAHEKMWKENIMGYGTTSHNRTVYVRRLEGG